MEGSPIGQEKIKVETNKEKLDELVALADEPLSIEQNQETYNKAEKLAREAFGGYEPGIKDNISHLALTKYNDKHEGLVEYVGASSPHTDWYNPNINWDDVQKAVEALWTINEKTSGVILPRPESFQK